MELRESIRRKKFCIVKARLYSIILRLLHRFFFSSFLLALFHRSHFSRYNNANIYYYQTLYVMRCALKSLHFMQYLISEGRCMMITNEVDDRNITLVKTSLAMSFYCFNKTTKAIAERTNVKEISLLSSQVIPL